MDKFDLKKFITEGKLLKENQSLKENEGEDFEKVILRVVYELEEYTSILSPGNYIKWKLDKAIKELEGILDEDEIELSFVPKPIKDEPKPETLDLDENQSEFERNTPGRIGQFIKDLDNLIEEYHAELYLKDGVFTGIDAVKAAALGEDDAMDDFVATDEDDDDSIFEDREAEEMAAGMPPRQGSEKDKEIKSKSFIVNSEYGGENYKLSYDERLDSPLRDMLEDNLEISNNKEDFIGKMTYVLTDSTSVLSLEDQDKLEDWYDSKISKNVELDKDIEDNPKSIEGLSNIDYLKDEYELLYSEKYPSGARRAGFKHRSTLGNDRYGDLYFHSNWPREFRHEDEYDNMSDDKQDILARVEEFEFEVDKLFDKYGVSQNSHAG